MIKNTKILIATGLYPPDIGGPATYSKLLVNELPKHGFEISVVSFGEVRKLPKVIRHISYFFKILNKGKNVDIIFAQDPVSVGFPAFFAARLLKKHFILKVVGDYAWEQHLQQKKNKNQLITPEMFQEGKYGLLTEIRRSMEHFVARRAEKIIVPSEYLKCIVTSWNINEKKIYVVYNGFRPLKKEGNKKTLKELIKFKGILAISAGRLVPWKGFEELIIQIPRIVKHFPDFKLYIVGSGPDEMLLEKLVTKLNLGKHVVLTGSFKQDVLLQYIKAADIFILNTFYEGFSHILLEAAALGTPIVTTSVGGNPEMLKNNHHALLIKYGDKKALEKAIIKILKDKELAKSLATKAQIRVQDFSEEDMIKNLTEVLKK